MSKSYHLHQSPMQWDWYPRIPPDVRSALSRWDDERHIQQVFYNRKLYTEDDVWNYVKGQYAQSCDPFELPDMERAIHRVHKAIDGQEHIAVYGDYDVDGVTATVLLVQLLQTYGANVMPKIPNRHRRGYGLHNDDIDELAGKGISLVITVDCGIKNLAEAKHARTSGLDLIITDHHTIPDDLPEALAVINPQRHDSDYPEKMLPGVAVAFKFAQALLAQHPPPRQSAPGCNPNDYLDLVALGTVADLAPLRGENRFLVKEGLKRINQEPRLGIKALVKVARLNSEITARDISFALGPRLNSPGRLDESAGADLAYDLLVEQDATKADQLANELNNLNRVRRKKTRALTQHAEKMAVTHDDDPLIMFASDADYNIGLVGLAASNLMNKNYRPVLIARPKNGEITGSARSIETFSIIEALDQCSDLLTRHGGHKVAAGFTLPQDNWEPFVDRMKEIAAIRMPRGPEKQGLLIDTEVELSDLTPRLAHQISYFEPIGQGNRTPLFSLHKVEPFDLRTIGKDKQHLKFKLRGDDGQLLDAIAFGGGKQGINIPKLVDIAFEWEVNEWQSEKRLQLKVKDITEPTEGKAN